MKKTEGGKIPNKLEKLPGPGNTWFTFVKDLVYAEFCTVSLLSFWTLSIFPLLFFESQSMGCWKVSDFLFSVVTFCDAVVFYEARAGSAEEITQKKEHCPRSAPLSLRDHLLSNVSCQECFFSLILFY